jgi:hypothetical protein
MADEKPADKGGGKPAPDKKGGGDDHGDGGGGGFPPIMIIFGIFFASFFFFGSQTEEVLNPIPRAAVDAQTYALEQMDTMDVQQVAKDAILEGPQYLVDKTVPALREDIGHVQTLSHFVGGETWSALTWPFRAFFSWLFSFNLTERAYAETFSVPLPSNQPSQIQEIVETGQDIAGQVFTTDSTLDTSEPETFWEGLLKLGRNVWRVYVPIASLIVIFQISFILYCVWKCRGIAHEEHEHWQHALHPHEHAHHGAHDASKAHAHAHAPDPHVVDPHAGATHHHAPQTVTEKKTAAIYNMSLRHSEENELQFKKILEHASSDNINDWKAAIIDADVMLDKGLKAAGYTTGSLGDRMKGISNSNVRTIDLAWEAHKLRNDIAHGGQAFNLTDRDVRRAVGQYQEVLKELGILRK